MGRFKIYGGLLLVVCSCASSQKPAESGDLVMPEWTKAPVAKAPQQTQRIRAKPGELVGDAAPERSTPREKKKKSNNFSKDSDSRIYGGCGALNGQECP